MQIKQHLLSDTCPRQFGWAAPCNVKLIWYRNCSPFRFSAHKSSIYSGSLPSAILSISTVNTMKCSGVFQRRSNNMEFIKNLCTYHCFIAASFLFTKYSLTFIKCNYSQPYCKVKDNIHEEKLYSFFGGVRRFKSLMGPRQNMILGSLLLSLYLF
jgi:hypothetical protein